MFRSSLSSSPRPAGAAELVVVGAGSAGAVIAARVTERADREVLLLEAGPDYPDPEGLPADLRDGTRNSWLAHDWGYRHRPTPGQIMFLFPRGKVVGGSSAVNTCIAVRGQPYDYDEWAALGLPEWGFDACLPYFKRLEDDLDFGEPWHGTGGPVPIRRARREELVPWQAAFVDGCRALGYPECADTNDPRAPGGVGPHAMNKIDGQRMSAARCYLTAEVRRRENLRLRPRTTVRRVLVRNRRVEGVEIETDGRVEVVATRKVVLSAGAIATPGILLRSGIGPRAELARLGVALVSDVPAVGARLLDHPGAVIGLWPRRRGLIDVLRQPLVQTMLRYTSRGSPYPNDVMLQPGSFFPLHPRLTIPAFAIACCIGKPRGVGRIEHASADPHARPRIASNMLVDRDDLSRAVDALTLAYEIARTAPMRELGWFVWPTERTLMRREALERWITRSCGSGYHPCGTAPMGPEGDVSAAVDGRGRVRGVEGLVVADASIMPTIPSVNTNLTALMIGERFGEWLRDGAV
ncbi:Choline dehydrogenase [Sorangium cellulosum So ce56]|uniref:Choline dehydrogenase n=1 Tax=Sorangium cellulosum (strain So ce56) TaxID=448385 RepID=A9GRM7_SORC5|nr:GMC family oxidoreductase N-terminal domain-containing protein [Sorangium cellulosum]CAN93646.1 Choline dehydrogenase [Sorangium cellulosum So ce56]